NADTYPNIRAIDLESGQDTRLLEAWVSDNNLSLYPDGQKLLFSSLDTVNNYYVFRDLRVLDLTSNKAASLTSGQRISDADLSPDGKRIVFVNNELGTRRLMLMKSDGSEPRLLCAYEPDAQYHSPRWSPDGQNIVVAKWTRGGEQKIYLVDAATGQQQRLTFSAGLVTEANPCYSAHGDYVYFDSDRSGIVDLYACHLSSQRLFMITNVLGGAMMPAASPDGHKLAYVSYSSSGYDIALLDIVPGLWKEVQGPVTVTKPISLPETSLLAEELEIHDYDPVPTLLPKFWLPVDHTTENGAQTSIYTQGSDILGLHQYQLTYGYDWQSERSSYSFLYVNNQFVPQLSFQFTDNPVSYSWYGTTLWMRHAFSQIACTLYDNRVFSEWDRLALAVGYEQTLVTNIDSLASFSTPPDLGGIRGLLMALRYANARRYEKSISYEDGIDATVQVQMNSSALGSDYTYTTYSLDADAYYSSPLARHVLAPSLYGFYSKGEQLEQSNFSWDYLPLRGYPSTNLRGNKGVLLKTEYRLPLWYAEKSVMYGYTFLDRVWAALFFDVGGAILGPVSNLSLKRSYGAELNFNTLSFWYLPADLTLGYAKGLDAGGEEKYYFTISM
ncbi:hypothetical protein ACFL1W_00725, partial [Candidatus Margulisiibacteriota bacterium]